MVSTNKVPQVNSSADSSDDSSYASIAGYSATVMPSDTNELAALVKVLTHYSACNSLMWCALQQLQIENAEFCKQLRRYASGTASSTNTPASAATPPNPPESHAKDFNQLGRSFCVLNEIWVSPSHLSQPFPENLRDIGPWHSDRYRNDQTKHEAIIAELYGAVPPCFHKYLEGSPFFANKVRVTPIP